MLEEGSVGMGVGPQLGVASKVARRVHHQAISGLAARCGRAGDHQHAHAGKATVQTLVRLATSTNGRPPMSK